MSEEYGEDFFAFQIVGKDRVKKPEEAEVYEKLGLKIDDKIELTGEKSKGGQYVLEKINRDPNRGNAPILHFRNTEDNSLWSESLYTLSIDNFRKI